MNAEELCLSLFYFFKQRSCRKEDLLQIEESLGLDELIVLHHIQSHWLSLVPAVERVLQIQGALKKLFQDLLKRDKTIHKNNRYLSIKSAVESREVQLEREFIKSIKPLFDDFLTKFQKEESMVHLLSPSCQNLLKGVMGRLLKSKLSVAKKARI